MKKDVDLYNKEYLVKHYLLLGRSGNSIAKQLKIAPHTVAKIMEKLIQNGELSEELITRKRDLRKDIFDVIIYDIDIKLAAENFGCEEKDIRLIIDDIMEENDAVKKKVLERKYIAKGFMFGRSLNSIIKQSNRGQPLVTSVRDKLIQFGILSVEDIEKKKKLRAIARDVIIYEINPVISSLNLGSSEEELKTIVDDILSENSGEKDEVLRKKFIVDSVRLGKNHRYIAESLGESRENLEAEISGMYKKGFLKKEEADIRRKLRNKIKSFIMEGKSIEDIGKLLLEYDTKLIEVIYLDIEGSDELLEDLKLKRLWSIKRRLSIGQSRKYIAEREGVSEDELERIIQRLSYHGKIDIEELNNKRNVKKKEEEEKEKIENKIIERILLGQTYIQIASILGVTESFVEKVVSRAIKQKRITVKIMNQIRKTRTKIKNLLEKGKSEKEIAEILEIAVEDVERFKKDLIENRETTEKIIDEARKRVDKDRESKKRKEDIIIDRIKTGVTRKKIAEEIGIKPTTVYHYINKFIGQGLLNRENIYLARLHRKDVIKMLDSGESAGRIAYILGIPEEVVIDIQTGYMRDKRNSLSKKEDDKLDIKRKWIETIAKLNNRIENDRKGKRDIRDLIKYTEQVYYSGILDKDEIVVMQDVLKRIIYFVKDENQVLVCYKLIISSYINLGDYQRALKWCNMALNLEIDTDTENFKEMGKQLSKKIRFQRIYRKIKSKSYSWNDIGELAKEEGVSEIEARQALRKYFFKEQPDKEID